MKTLLLVPMVALGACSTGRGVEGDTGLSGSQTLDYGMLAFSTTYVTDTNGVFIPDDRPWSVAGMYGLTCQLNMEDGTTGTDLDVAPEKETVVDGLGASVLIDGDDGFQIVEFPRGGYGDHWTLPIGGQSRLIANGHVDLAYEQGACKVTFRDAHVAVVELPAHYCGGSMVADNEGTVWVGSDASIARVTVAGYSELPIGGQELAIDRASGTVLAGAVGSDHLTALLADGTALWSVQFDSPVAGFDTANGLAVVNLSGVRVGSQVVVLDQASGDELSRQYADFAPPGRVTATADFVAIDSGSQFDFLRF